MFGPQPAAVVQKAQPTAQQLIDAAKQADIEASRRRWTIGECASKYIAAEHRTEEQFANRTGISQQRVNEYRRIWDERQDYRARGKPSWSHLRVSLSWDDWQECLDIAAENGWSLREMEAWRNAKHGSMGDASSDYRAPAKNTDSQQASDPDSSSQAEKDATTPPAPYSSTGEKTSNLAPACGKGNAAQCTPTAEVHALIVVVCL